MDRDAALVVLGAFLAGIVGVATQWWQDRRRRTATRKALGTLLRHELALLADPPYTIVRDTPMYTSIRHHSLDLILSAGVINPDREEHFLANLIYLSSVVDEYNERAQAYQLALATGNTGLSIHQLHRDLNDANETYREAGEGTLLELWRLDGKIFGPDPYAPPDPHYSYLVLTLRPLYRRLRRAWVTRA